MISKKLKQDLEQLRAQDEEKAGRWLVTYCSLAITLVAVFMMLVSYSTVSGKKISSYRKGMRLETAASSRISASASDPAERAITTIRDHSLMSGYSGQVQIARTQYGFKVTIPSQMAFAPESSQIQQEVLPLLGVMTGILKKGLFSVGIAGYTSSHPINETGLSDWELSGNRSSAIMRYFKETGNIAATRLASVGYGQYRPATSESSGNENDRLELNFVIREDVTG